jgi:hypothetical protein
LIEVRCQACGKTVRVNDSYAGKQGKCLGCETTLTVPSPSNGSTVQPSVEQLTVPAQAVAAAAPAPAAAPLAHTATAPSFFCPMCGTGLPQGAAFCMGCGTAMAGWSSGQPALVPAGPPASPPQRAAHAAPANPTWPTRPGAIPPSLSGGFLGGQVIALIGYVMLVIGPFLPWMTVYIFSGISASGLQMSGNEALMLVFLGIVGMAVGIVSLALKRAKFVWVPFMVGLVGLGISIWYYVQLHGRLSDPEIEDFAVSLGTGIYLCLVASVVVLVGGCVAVASRKR